MKIAMVNKFWNGQYGTGVHLDQLVSVLTKHGHQVIPFATRHPQNKKTKYAKYFTPYHNMQNASLSWRSAINVLRMIYNPTARKCFAEFLDRVQPDIVHVHTIHHHLSPSILLEAKKRDIPIVHTAHDDKLICPSYHVPFRDGKVCEQCVGQNWMHVIKHRAHKNSLLATLAVVLESAVHHWTRVYHRTIDRYIMPSRDIAQRHVEQGYDPERVRVVSHMIDCNEWKPALSLGSGVLFAGRLAAERGLEHVIKAAQDLPEHTFTIAGEGPERATLEAKIKTLGLKNINLLGQVDARSMRKLYARHRVLFFPTQMFEPFGMSILEAMATGKPVVATHLGAIPELVEHEKTGFTYDAHDPSQGSAFLRTVLERKITAQQMGEAARKKAEEFNPERYYQELERVYSEAIAEHERNRAVSMAAQSAEALS